MVRRPAVLISATVLLALALAGCSTGSDSEAVFVRYEKAPDGRRMAVVRSVDAGADPSETRAWVGSLALKPGQTVIVREEGKDWDQPQWAPTAEIVRAK